MKLWDPSIKALCRSQETEATTIPVENVALTTKDQRKENTTYEWDDGGKIGK